MFTVIETPSFTRLWPDYWDEDERGEFVTWLAGDPEAGDVIRESGGCRKVGDLLQPAEQRRDLVADDVREKRSRFDRGRYFEKTQGIDQWQR
jgi:hypothetical protein